MKKYILISLFGLVSLLIIIALFRNYQQSKEPPIDKVAILIKNSSDPSKNIPHTPLKIIHDKKFGLTRMIMCVISDTNWLLIKNECNDLIGNEKIGFVYGYKDESKVWNITKFENALDAFPEEGKDYVFEYKITPGKRFKEVEITKFVNNFK